MQYFAKDLFQLQAELVEGKVDMAVSRAIDRVIDQISGLRIEMHELKHEMNKNFSALDKRIVAVETKLGMVAETKKAIRTKLLEYTFQAGWIGFCVLVSYLLVHLHF